MQWAFHIWLMHAEFVTAKTLRPCVQHRGFLCCKTANPIELQFITNPSPAVRNTSVRFQTFSTINPGEKLEIFLPPFSHWKGIRAIFFLYDGGYFKKSGGAVSVHAANGSNVKRL